MQVDILHISIKQENESKLIHLWGRENLNIILVHKNKTFFN